MPYPKSPYEKVGGMVYVARSLDKIRLFAAGKLPEEYHPYLGKGMDGRFIAFLHLEYAKLVERTLKGGSDEEILQWAFENGRSVNKTEIDIWNGFMTKRGLCDDGSEILEKFKKESGLGDRSDVVTFFGYYDVDEKRKP